MLFQLAVCVRKNSNRFRPEFVGRAEFPPDPPSARLRKRPLRIGRFQVFLWRQILLQFIYVLDSLTLQAKKLRFYCAQESKYFRQPQNNYVETMFVGYKRIKKQTHSFFLSYVFLPHSYHNQSFSRLSLIL